MLKKELVPNLNLVKLYIKASKEMKLFYHIKHRVMHAYCIRVSNGDLSLQDKNILLKYYLIDPLYAEAACKFFNSIDGKDIITWNTLLHGFAVQHQFERCLVIFHELIEQQLSPDAVTFLGLLVSCRHFGNLAFAYDVFDSMESKYGITPNVMHYTTMVSLIGGIVNAKEAYDFINKRMVLVKPNKAVWVALVASCGKNGDFELAEFICKEKLPEGEGDEALHHLYASSKDYDKAGEVRKRIERPENKRFHRAAFSMLVED